MIEAEKIGRRIGEGQWLFRDITLSLRAGQRVALRGPSGGGKTILLRAVALLDPLTCGEVRWREQALLPDRIPSYRRHVIYLHQRAALFEGTVEDNLRAPFDLQVTGSRAYSRERILEWLGMVEREDSFLEKWHTDLSGGEAQLTALLRAILLDPEVLLLDEPTSALDAPTAQAVERLVQAWYQEKNDQRAYVWVSHDEAQGERVGEITWHMNQGRLQA